MSGHYSNYQSGGLNLNAGHFAQLSEWVISSGRDEFVDKECSCFNVPCTNSISILPLSVRCFLCVPTDFHLLICTLVNSNLGYTFFLINNMLYLI